MENLREIVALLWNNLLNRKGMAKRSLGKNIGTMAAFTIYAEKYISLGLLTSFMRFPVFGTCSFFMLRSDIVVVYANSN
jgi:hypothetical protein